MGKLGRERIAKALDDMSSSDLEWLHEQLRQRLEIDDDHSQNGRAIVPVEELLQRQEQAHQFTLQQVAHEIKVINRRFVEDVRANVLESYHDIMAINRTLHRLDVTCNRIVHTVIAAHGPLLREVLRDLNERLGADLAAVDTAFSYATGKGWELPDVDFSRVHELYNTIKHFLSEENDKGDELRALVADEDLTLERYIDLHNVYKPGPKKGKRAWSRAVADKVNEYVHDGHSVTNAAHMAVDYFRGDEPLTKKPEIEARKKVRRLEDGAFESARTHYYDVYGNGKV